MLIRKILSNLIFCFACACSSVQAEGIHFRPVDGIDAVVSEGHGKVTYKITDREGVVEKSIDVDTESKLHLSIGDYRFDGKKGFAISYLDEGMGVYEVYRIFTYSRKLRDFEEQSPACGDEFLNLKLDSKKRVIQSTYFSGNEPRICVTKLKRN
ncbi:hypothetical protein [Paraburkholderia nodosa]|uniref:hypothetical protein n=1 Tax=Paraburkholderia nodosa TaxID=392320 RepID=UPI001B80573E|nr:hypothetical protein [Paraburkholderia nodosa]